ncbi:UPF0462 protein C4orf33-like [Parasteatoda tepidariorum]|uniref:UPF0462 protein C4orf33-like n=1 Tax=Parasteatoda tepidariorum TaxID=114398 RepID=UPI001C72758D|nr:UPF0462 protein C4orf33-like [Parasteatoda tepidariorum]
MEFSILTTWDDKPIDHEATIIKLHSEDDVVIMEIKAPFYDDPPPNPRGTDKSFNKLWDYEVVEAFFLGKAEKYLEVEFSPHGFYFILLLAGRKNAIKVGLPIVYTANIEGNSWTGIARIPKSYFPPNVKLFNAYAIHGTGKNRTYEALNPVPTGQFQTPDFHRLEYFRYIQFETILDFGDRLSDVWKAALEEKGI